MKSLVKLFLILITITLILFAWITHQLGNPRTQLLIVVLIGFSFLAFIIINILDRREERKKREARESRDSGKADSGRPVRKPSETSYSLREKKAGLTWGGGNIKASEATRGTKRRFLGR
jgi:di/tricarboxylate transporter